MHPNRLPTRLLILSAIALALPAWADESLAMNGGDAPSAPLVAGALSAPAPVPTPVPALSATPVVPVLEPAAPPEWAQELITAAQELPVVGPIVAKVLLWTGILSGILTTLVGTLIAIVNTLLGVANLAGLAKFASALAAFRDGKIMYWLKFFSLFNAKKKEPPAGPSVLS